jgi:uncharacterized membrane protein (DUF485 family)
MKSTDAIRALPEFKALTRARKRVVWPLSIVTMSAYFFLILAIAFFPESLGKPVAGGTTSIGISLGLGMILLCFVVTGIYVYYANRVLEPLNRAIVVKAEELS